MIYLTSLHFYKKFLIGSAYIMPYVRKQNKNVNIEIFVTKAEK